MASRRPSPDEDAPDFSFLGDTADSAASRSLFESNAADKLAETECTGESELQPLNTFPGFPDDGTEPLSSGSDLTETAPPSSPSSGANEQSREVEAPSMPPPPPVVTAATQTPSAREKEPHPIDETPSRIRRATSEPARAAAPARRAVDDRATRMFGAVLGYAIALTLVFLILFLTGRLSLFGNHALESLPDIRPLEANEFQKIPDGAVLPVGHTLHLGQSRRFGDVLLTPLKVTREPLQFQGFLSGKPVDQMTTAPVLKLWLQFENVASDYAFAPWDAGLMAHRSPTDGNGESVLANSFLSLVRSDTAPVDPERTGRSRILNFLHSPNSNLVIAGQNAGQIIRPHETLTTFVASENAIESSQEPEPTKYTWRVQIRKGVHLASGHGVTTLVDVQFSEADVTVVTQSDAPAPIAGRTAG